MMCQGPACFSQWETGAPIYMPLVWQLKCVAVCPLHPQHYLEVRCPHCNQLHFGLSRHSLAGRCPKCLRWLGTQKNLRNPTASEQAAAAEVHALLGSISAGDCHPSIRALRSNLRLVRDQCYHGSLLALARASRLHHSSLQELVLGQARPGLDTLIQLARASGLGVERLVSSRLKKADLLHPGRVLQVGVATRRKLRKYDWVQIGKMLREATQLVAASSLHSLCRQSGLDQGYVTRKFPKEARLLVERFRSKRSARHQKRLDTEVSDVNDAVITCVQHRVWPSYRRLKRMLRSPGSLRRPDMWPRRDQMIKQTLRKEVMRSESVAGSSIPIELLAALNAKQMIGGCGFSRITGG